MRAVNIFASLIIVAMLVIVAVSAGEQKNARQEMPVATQQPFSN
jgi:hypothetical protein